MTFELIPRSTSQTVDPFELKSMARCSAFGHSAIMILRSSVLPCVGSSMLDARILVLDVLPHALGISCRPLLCLALSLCPLDLPSSSSALISFFSIPVHFAVLLIKHEIWHPSQWLKMKGRRWSSLAVVLQAW